MSTHSQRRHRLFHGLFANPVEFAHTILRRKKSRSVALEQVFDLKWSRAHAGARPSASSPMLRDQFRKISPDAKIDNEGMRRSITSAASRQVLSRAASTVHKKKLRARFPRHTTHHAPVWRRLDLQSPLRAIRDRDEQHRQRLMIGPAKFTAVNEDGADRVEQEHGPAIAKSHSTRPRPPPFHFGVAVFRSSLRAKAKAGPARIRTWDQGIMSPLL